MQRHPVLTAFLTCATGLAALSYAAPASALTMTECSAKYKAAQTSGSLGGMSWNDFRKAQCGPTASAAPATTGTTAPPQKMPSPTAAKPSAPMVRGNVTFPSAVSPKYAKESAGKARMHTCLDQYNANKDAGGTANGGLKWIQKGGGYYSQCNARLKTAS